MPEIEATSQLSGPCNDSEALKALRHLLITKGLYDKVAKAEEWCSVTGAAFPSEIEDHWDDLANKLVISASLSAELLAALRNSKLLSSSTTRTVRFELKRALTTPGNNHFKALISSGPIVPQQHHLFLVRASTTDLSGSSAALAYPKAVIACNSTPLPGQAVLHHFHRSKTIMFSGSRQPVSAAPGNHPLLHRTITVPITPPEVQGATVRLKKAYIPLAAWAQMKQQTSQAFVLQSPFRQQPPKTEVSAPDKTDSFQVQKALRLFHYRDLQSEHQLQNRPRWSTPPPRSDERLIRRPIPGPEMLQNPFEEEIAIAQADKEAAFKDEALRRQAQQAKSKRPTSTFEHIRQFFIQEHGHTIRTNLERQFHSQVVLKPTPIAPEVQDRFVQSVESIGSAGITPTYHGTNVANYPSIYNRGLLIPGKNNSLSVANGSAHGLGVYTARVEAPGLSVGFSSGSSGQSLLVCGVVDDSRPKIQHEVCGRFPVTAASQVVKHVGDAVVVFDSSRVVPLFEASTSTDGESGGRSMFTQPSRPAANPIVSTSHGSILNGPDVQPTAKSYFVDRGKGKVYHVATKTTAFLPPEPVGPVHFYRHDIEQKRIYERRLRDVARKEAREDKAELCA